MSNYKDTGSRNQNNFKALKGGEMNSSVTVGSDTVFAKPLEVKVYGDSFDKAMRAFRALVQKERILSKYKERQTYEKPSEKKRRKLNESKRKYMELKYDKVRALPPKPTLKSPENQES